MKKIYVGNLPFSATDDEVRSLFGEYGDVESVNLITDRETGRPRGFGFVEMADGADEAVQKLDQTDMGGRTLNVSEARPRRDNGGGGCLCAVAAVAGKRFDRYHAAFFAACEDGPGMNPRAVCLLSEERFGRRACFGRGVNPSPR